jgi:hypothetical protein
VSTVEFAFEPDEELLDAVGVADAHATSDIVLRSNNKRYTHFLFMNYLHSNVVNEYTGSIGTGGEDYVKKLWVS